MVDHVTPTIRINDYANVVLPAYDLVTTTIACYSIWGRIVASNIGAIGGVGTGILHTDARGQSFTPDTDCTLSAIQFPVAIGSTSQDITVRIGTSPDLSASHFAEYTCGVVVDPDGYATVLTDRQLRLQGGTEYFLGIIRHGDGPFYVRVNLFDNYPGGKFLVASSGWTMVETPEYDLNFLVWGLVGK